MLDNLMLFLIISVFALFYWIYYTDTRKSPFVTQWDQLPTREQYLAAHPEAIDGDIIFCIHYGHHQQLDVGLVHQTDFRRQHICTRCKKTLYREEL